MASPGGRSPNRGCRFLTRELVSRILFDAVIPLGAALPRTLISDLPGGSRRCMRSPFEQHMPEPLERIGPMRSAAWLRAGASLPIWSCSVWGLPCRRHYCRRGALLPHLFTLTRTGRPGIRPSGQTTGCPRSLAFGDRRRLSLAVCFLWHWPSTDLEVRVPDVIRHTALRSSDFPLPAPALAETGSDRPVLLPDTSLPRKRVIDRPQTNSVMSEASLSMLTSVFGSRNQLRCSEAVLVPSLS